ncbi:MAG: FAD-dependent monooxygenase [Pseudomonadota bacterium]
MRISNAIVVGGGIGGLSVATALAQQGVAVTLLEQAEALRDVGAGLQVSPNGMVVLRALGLESALRERAAVACEAVVLRDRTDGAQVARLDLARLRPDARYLFLHRADLIAVLAAAAQRANVSFELGKTVAAVRPGDLPSVQLADGTTRRAELVVAADGVHSTARAVLNGPERAQFSGQVAWRAVVPNEVGHPAEAHVTMGPGRHVVSYPLRAGRWVNLVAVEERETWAAESWSQEDDPAHLRAAFAGFGGQTGEVLQGVDKAHLWGLHLHPVAETWAQEGVALLGDAAHPSLPFLAQGANLALEDGYVLAAAVAAGGRDWAARYQMARRARAVRVIRAAAGNAWRYHLQDGPIRWLAHRGLGALSRFAPGRMVGAFDWLYGFDVTAHPP